MEKLVEDGHGVTVLLAGLVIILSLHLITKIGHFIWEFNQEKHQLTEKSIDNLTQMLASNTSAIHSLEEKLSKVHHEIEALNRFKIDIRLLIDAVKHLAGDKWPEIRKIIIEDKFLG